MTVTSQDISPFASLHEWLNRVKNGIQHAADGVGDAWKHESEVPCTSPTTTPATAAGVVENKAAPSAVSPSTSATATSLIRLYLDINDVVHTMAASPIYDTLGTSAWPTLYMPPLKRQYTFDQHNPSMQKIALSISSHTLTESLLTSKTAFLSLLAHAPYTHAEQWNRALSIWSHWKSMIQPDATIMTHTPHYTFHVRVIYPQVPNWNGAEISSQTRCEKIRNYCRDAYHLLPMSNIPIGPMTKLCEENYQDKTLECILGRAIQQRYGWKCQLRKPDIQFLVTFEDDVMRIGITMYDASFSQYLTHLSHTGPNSLFHTIHHIHDAPHVRWDKCHTPLMSHYHLHASIHFLHDLTIRMLRTKSFLDAIQSSSSLITACSQGEFKMAHILMQLGCDIYAKDTSGMNALVHAARHGENSVVAWLLDEKGFTWNTTLRSALLGALDGDHYDTIALLLTSLHSTPGIPPRGCDMITTLNPIIEHAIIQQRVVGLMQILDDVDKRMKMNGKNQTYESLITSWFLTACATHDMIVIEPFIILYMQHHHKEIKEKEDVDELTASMALIQMNEKNQSTPFTVQLQHHIKRLPTLTHTTALSFEPQFTTRYVNTMRRALMTVIHSTQKQEFRDGIIPYAAYMSRDEINIIMSYCVGNAMEWNKK